jgi:hypothetical protein
MIDAGACCDPPLEYGDLLLQLALVEGSSLVDADLHLDSAPRKRDSDGLELNLERILAVCA